MPLEETRTNLDSQAIGEHLRFGPSLRPRRQQGLMREHVNEGIVAVLVVSVWRKSASRYASTGIAELT